MAIEGTIKLLQVKGGRGGVKPEQFFRVGVKKANYGYTRRKIPGRI